MSLFEKIRAWLPYEKITEALATCDSNHGQVHAGNAFTLCHSKSLAAGGTMNLAMDIPAGAYVHFQAARIMFNSGLKLEIFENVTSYANGSAVVPSNKHRIINRASVITCKKDVDTIVGGSNLIDPMFMGATGAPNKVSIGGATGDDSEWVLKGGYKYLIKLTNLDGSNAQNVALLPFWYEETAA